jgi:hypothetical protein
MSRGSGAELIAFPWTVDIKHHQNKILCDPSVVSMTGSPTLNMYFVDLLDFYVSQGVGDLWTDPQIHTTDGCGFGTFPLERSKAIWFSKLMWLAGEGNLGLRGIQAFLNSHICNSICAGLRLSSVGRAKADHAGTQMQ